MGDGRKGYYYVGSGYVRDFMYLCSVKKPLLYEISVIRPLVIFLLVVYHALCVFTGGWQAPPGVPENGVYWWLGRLISGFRIETIAFVGGYVFCYQCVETDRRTGLLPFVWKKFKRLIVPCFVFGIAFYALFCYRPERFRLYVAFWRVANGVSHLWFLPMLFWCFLTCWLFDRLLDWLSRRHSAWLPWTGRALLAVLAGVSLLRVTGLRMGLSRAPYFMFYFYLGYWLRYELFVLRRPRHVGDRRRGWLAAALWGLYAVLLLLHLQATHLRLPGFGFDCPHWLRGCSRVTLRLMALGHTTCGLLALYATVTLWLRRHREPGAQPSAWLRECSRLCYGVYVLHMFFLQWLYYYSPVPAWCCGTAAGAWLMPWGVLAVTLALSAGGTWLLLQSRTGRFLIG